MLESDEVREYFESMLNNQTEQVKNYINDSKTQLTNDEIDQFKKQLVDEKNRVQDLERIVQDTKAKLDTVNSELEEKKDLLNKTQSELKITQFDLQKKDLKVSQLENEKTSIEEQSEVQITEIKDKLNRMLTAKSECDERLKILNEKYGDIDKAIENYHNLSAETQGRLHNIIKDDSVYSIIGASADWRNIEGIWEFAKRRVVEKEYEDAELLGEIFEFLLKAYNAQYRRSKYDLIKPAIGDKFDSDIHSIIGIQTDGFVRMIHLSGIINVENTKVVQKALIEV